jgi:hypothetical protein
MAAERRDKEINGKTYSILLPSPKAAMGLCTEAGIMFAPLLGGIGAITEGAGVQVLSMMVRGVNPEVLNAMFLRVVEMSKLSCNNQPVCDTVTFEQHFDNNRKDLYPVCGWALWECTRDFLPDLGSLSQNAKVKTILEMLSKFQKDGPSTTG